MDQKCKSEICRSKLKDYRDLTRKQDDDIDTLETDIRDKDAFAQTVVKSRNDLQKELTLLKKKNADLLNQNKDLLEKVDQLDEDTETGMMFLKNAHERERKLNVEVKELKDGIHIKNDAVNEAAKQNEELKRKFHFVKDKFQQSLKENQELQGQFNSKDVKLQELEMQLVSCKEELDKSRKFEEHEEELKVQVEKVKELKVVLEGLAHDNNLLTKKFDDITDELANKTEKLHDIENQGKQKSLQSSQSSLSEELQNLKVINCENCGSYFLSLEELKEHKKEYHTNKYEFNYSLMLKIVDLERRISEQKSNLTSNIFELKRKEIEKSHTCSCRAKNVSLR